MIKPKYTHDCDACRFIGRLDGHDCYIHETPSGVTFVKRRSDDGPDYTSRSFYRGFPPEGSNKPVLDWAILERMAQP